MKLVFQYHAPFIQTDKSKNLALAFWIAEFGDVENSKMRRVSFFNDLGLGVVVVPVLLDCLTLAGCFKLGKGLVPDRVGLLLAAVMLLPEILGGMERCASNQ